MNAESFGGTSRVKETFLPFIFNDLGAARTTALPNVHYYREGSRGQGDLYLNCIPDQ